MRKKKKYRYFISYMGKQAGNMTVGNYEVFLNRKITTIDDVKTISLRIAAETGLDGTPTIINYELFGKVIVE